MAKIKIEGITKSFLGKRVLDNVTLEVKDGSFTCILGPPEAGKTTLLRIIAGVETPDSGSIYIDGEDVTDLPPKDRGIAMVYQSYALYPHMTVYENIASPLRAMKLPKEEIDRKVNEVAQFLRISHLLFRSPRVLSGGEAQRVAIGRAIVREAKAYMLDEPLMNLDYKIREDMRGELRRMCKDLGMTIIYATPDPIDVLVMGEYVAMLNEGRVEQYGQVEEVYEHPANLFVGGYFGSPPMNLVDCALVRKEGKMLLEASSISVDITPFKQKLQGYTRLVLGIRPHHLHIVKEPVEREVSFESELYLSEVIGSETIVHAKVGDILLKAHLPYMYQADIGTKFLLSFDLSNIYIFDKDSGANVMLGDA